MYLSQMRKENYKFENMHLAGEPQEIQCLYYPLHVMRLHLGTNFSHTPTITWPQEEDRMALFGSCEVAFFK